MEINRNIGVTEDWISALNFACHLLSLRQFPYTILPQSDTKLFQLLKSSTSYPDSDSIGLGLSSVGFCGIRMILVHWTCWKKWEVGTLDFALIDGCLCCGYLESPLKFWSRVFVEVLQWNVRYSPGSCVIIHWTASGKQLHLLKIIGSCI